MKRMFYTEFSLGVLVGIICLVIAGCGGSSSGGSSGTSSQDVAVVDCSIVTPAATIQATQNNNFSPSTQTISANDVVQWTSASTTNHTVTSGTSPSTADGKFDQPLDPGTSVCLKFTVAGTYNYYCSFHYPLMVGVITVQ
jgi:plastocyanin